MRELLVALTEGDIEAATLNGHEPRSATALEADHRQGEEGPRGLIP